MVKVELIIVEHDGHVRHELWRLPSLIEEDAVLDLEGQRFRVHRVIESPTPDFDAIALVVEAEGKFEPAEIARKKI
jgi:hypothetical protein